MFLSHVYTYRCHTFGIGGEVCVELVTGIAAASGGQCVLLSPTERLQTKVGIVIILVLHVPLLCQYTMGRGHIFLILVEICTWKYMCIAH